MQWAPTSACERTRETGAGEGTEPVKGLSPCATVHPAPSPKSSPLSAGEMRERQRKRKKKYFCLFLLLPLLKADEAAGPFPAGSCPGAQPGTPHPLTGPPPASPLRNSHISLPYPPALLFFFFFPVSTAFDSRSQRDPHPPAHHRVTSTRASFQPSLPAPGHAGAAATVVRGGKGSPQGWGEAGRGLGAGLGWKTMGSSIPLHLSPRKSQFNPRLPSKRKGFGPMALQIFKPKTAPGLGKGGNDIFLKAVKKQQL